MSGPRRELFDAYAADYDRALAEGIAVSGEDKEFFARERVAWLRHRLDTLGERPKSVLDFGCSTGGATPFLRERLAPETIVGVDPSRRSIEIAVQTYGDRDTRFICLQDFTPDGSLDLAFSNGVFHHVPPAERAAAGDLVRRSLRPGGLFALWENNPWNPGARYVMRKIPFDRDAVMLWPAEARELLRSAGFEILATDSRFLFPRALAWLRPIETSLARWPFGAQYQVLARKC